MILSIRMTLSRDTSPHRLGRQLVVLFGGDVSEFSDAAIVSNDADHHYDNDIMFGKMMTTTVAAAYEYSRSSALLQPPGASTLPRLR